jgi:CheY-like chemotaxis protein
MFYIRTMNCILIDDDEEEIDIFQFAIRNTKLAIHFKGYSSFDAALKGLGDFKQLPDYIFLDGFLKPLTGKEILQSIKSDTHLSKIPVIIYSGYVSEQEQNELMSLGAYHVMKKPSNVTLLTEELNTLFASRK